LKLTQKIKSLLKRSGFIIGAVRALRAGLVDIKKLYWFAIRIRKIQIYLDNNSIRKLQLATSNSLLAGWLNTDLLPTSQRVIYLDATRRFPFQDDTFDYIYSEHMIEHLDHPSAVSMLHECFRVLRAGGRIRISTPDLRVLVGLLSEERTARQNHYIDFMTRRFVPDAEYCTEVFVINNAFRAWGHQFLYDRAILRITLARVGFEGIEYYQPGVSDDDNLRGIDLHGRVMGCEEINQFEAFAIEGRVPDPKRPGITKHRRLRAGNPPLHSFGMAGRGSSR
jgi:predicted SAM-dependent methyltransferase